MIRPTGPAAVLLLVVVQAALGAQSVPASRASADAVLDALKEPILPDRVAHEQLTRFLLARAARLEIPEDPRQWLDDAERLRQRILDRIVLRGVPRAWLDEKPRVEETDRIRTGRGYSIRKIRYEGYPGLWVPALLYEPDSLAGKVPAVLNPNGHVGPPGKAVEYKQIRCINMAKRGMLALNLEWVGMGELGGPGYAHLRSGYLDLCGRSGLSVFYLTLKRGLDVLLSHPNADPERVAMTGLSGGGWQTIFFSSLDPRIRVVVPNAGYITLEPRALYVADTGDLEQNPTDLISIADYSHLTAMLAPRPTLLIYNAKDDCCFPAERARRWVYEPVRPLFEKLGLADEFQMHVNHDPGTHNYEKDNRLALYRFLNRHFLPAGSRQDDEIPCDGEIRTFDELKVGIPRDNADFVTLAAGMLPGLPRNRVPAGAAAAVESWQREARRALRDVLRFRKAPAQWQMIRHETRDGLHLRWGRLDVAGEWELPVLDLAPAGARPSRAVLVCADFRREAAAGTVRSLLDRGDRVIVMEPALFGETVPGGFQMWHVAEMVAAVGERPLGLAAAHLISAAECFRRDLGTDGLSLVGIGRVSGVAALAAAALDENGAIRDVTATDVPASLKLLIEERVDYAACAPLFCFGLLEVCDTRELAAMALPRRICLKATGSSERVQAELSVLEGTAAALGAPRVEYARP